MILSIACELAGGTACLLISTARWKLLLEAGALPLLPRRQLAVCIRLRSGCAGTPVKCWDCTGLLVFWYGKMDRVHKQTFIELMWSYL